MHGMFNVIVVFDDDLHDLSSSYEVRICSSTVNLGIPGVGASSQGRVKCWYLRRDVSVVSEPNPDESVSEAGGGRASRYLPSTVLPAVVHRQRVADIDG